MMIKRQGKGTPSQCTKNEERSKRPKKRRGKKILTIILVLFAREYPDRSLAGISSSSRSFSFLFLSVAVASTRHISWRGAVVSKSSLFKLIRQTTQSPRADTGMSLLPSHCQCNVWKLLNSRVRSLSVSSFTSMPKLHFKADCKFAQLSSAQPAITWNKDFCQIRCRRFQPPLFLSHSFFILRLHFPSTYTHMTPRRLGLASILFFFLCIAHPKPRYQSTARCEFSTKWSVICVFTLIMLLEGFLKERERISSKRRAWRQSKKSAKGVRPKQAGFWRSKFRDRYILNSAIHSLSREQWRAKERQDSTVGKRRRGRRRSKKRNRWTNRKRSPSTLKHQRQANEQRTKPDSFSKGRREESPTRESKELPF